MGVCLFTTGAGINLHSDAVLRELRGRAPRKYRMPRGGGFELVSTPHYAGEILEWIGFCVASNASLPSLAFVIYTAANLIPRGVAHHAWYQKHFPKSYPKERRAVIPFLW
jgi:hypothetical protein